MSKLAYVRTSTQEQETARQEKMMAELGIEKVFVEKASGKNTDRPELKRLMAYMREDDIIYVESISRLSRSVRDLLWIMDELGNKGVKFVSIKENIDTSSAQGRFVLNIFAALSELEREQILQRQAEGIAIAKAAGKYKGRKPKQINESLFLKLYKLWKNGDITAIAFMQELDLKSATFYRIIKRYESKGIINYIN